MTNSTEFEHWPKLILNMTKPIVIYDGECGFCATCLNWVTRKLSVDAYPFQSTDLKQFNLTYEACSKELHVIHNQKTNRGATAVALLLKLRGNRIASLIITFSGPLGRFGYKWVAGNRDSFLVRVIGKILS
jgi:predicted DCC family thiol-disulfide oxidoreductase YuxK